MRFIGDFNTITELKEWSQKMMTAHDETKDQVKFLEERLKQAIKAHQERSEKNWDELKALLKEKGLYDDTKSVGYLHINHENGQLFVKGQGDDDDDGMPKEITEILKKLGALGPIIIKKD